MCLPGNVLSLLSTIRFSVFPICLLYTNHQQLTVVAGPSVIAASTALSMGPLEITFLTDQKVNKATRERLPAVNDSKSFSGRSRLAKVASSAV